MDDLFEYLRAKDLDMHEQAYAWKTAIIFSDGIKREGGNKRLLAT